MRAVCDKNIDTIYEDMEDTENQYNYMNFEDEAYIYTLDEIISSYLFDD